MRQWPKKELHEFLADRFILVVEPAVNYRTSIKQFLTNLKVSKLKVVNSVAEARREMLTLKIGFFIVEWGLDGQNGLQFCRNLRQDLIFKDTPFLLLSVENLKNDVVLASEVEIDAYLLKPFSYEDFCSQIFTVIRNRTTPNRVNSLIQIGEERLTRGDLDGADRQFEEALKLGSGSARALCGRAQVAETRGDDKTALTLLREATHVNPDFIDAYKRILALCQKIGDQAGIIEAALYLHSLSPDNPKYTLILARSYMDQKHIEGSERYFRQTISLSPKLAEAYKGLGSVYMMADEYEKAMKNFRKALDLDSEDISTLNSLGMSLIRMGKWQEGIENYLMALKLDPSNASVLFNIGHAYEKKGDMSKAKFYYAQSLMHRAGYEKAIRGLERVEAKKTPTAS